MEKPDPPRKRGPAARRKGQPKLAWPLLQGVYGFPWLSDSLSAWSWLTMGFLLLGLLLIGCVHFLPAAPN